MSVSTVLCVAGVPLFAQSNSARPMIALDRTAAGIAREYLPARWSDGAPASLPANLIVLGPYRALLESMLRRSPIFARQCQRIGAATQLIVSLEVAAVRTTRTQRARTDIAKRRDGLRAAIVIGQPTHFVELVAHEFEHIIEQLDEIDLASKAALRHTGVEALDHDGRVFETVRAHRVGLRVAAEFRRSRDLRSFW